MPLKLLMAILGIVTELRKTEKNPEQREQSLASLTEGKCQLNFAFSYGQKMSEFSKFWIAFLARAKQSRWTF